MLDIGQSQLAILADDWCDYLRVTPVIVVGIVQTVRDTTFKDIYAARRPFALLIRVQVELCRA